uniref:Casein kinase I n=1 Tax=Alexandrium monilatum TaxID=311494 RepID=A0A7S4VP20_9DINO
MTSGGHKVATSIANGQIKVNKKLGAGCFGEVWQGVNTETKQKVAVKFEDVGAVSPQLEHEARMLELLRQPVQSQGFAEYYFYGAQGRWNCLVMEYLGKSLEDRVQACGGTFSVQTTVLVADQILGRIEYLHSKGIVHRDIKPENFLWGIREKQHHLYLIDFGLSKKYYERRHAHMRTRLNLTGTARYASLNAHRGVEQSRRDDFESIGHMLMYLLIGLLPWSGLEARTKKEKYQKIMEKKESTRLSDLCQGFPKAFELYLHRCRRMGVRERPDYNSLRKLFNDVRERIERESGQRVREYDFQWNVGKDLGHIVPLAPVTSLKQPDDSEARSRPRGLGCLCGGKGGPIE